MRWLADTLAGHSSPEATAHISRALRTWLSASSARPTDADGRPLRVRVPSLARCAGLPESPERTRRLLRDWYFAQAGQLVAAPDATDWGRAVALRDAVAAFMARKWPTWWDLSAPPMHASALERALWQAAAASGGNFPSSAERMHQLLDAAKHSRANASRARFDDQPVSTSLELINMATKFIDPMRQREPIMVRVRFLRPTLVNGAYCDVGTVADVPEADVRRMSEYRRVEATTERATLNPYNWEK